MVSGLEATAHVPVLAEAAMRWLEVKPGGVYVDCTVGAGGHASLIAAALQGGRLIAMDRDVDALEAARKRLAPFPGVTLVHRNHAELASVLEELKVERVDGVLIDAGISSMQLDDPDRGFTFQQAGPLDMRMDRTAGPSAREFLAAVDERELARLLKQYGDVGPVRRIASAIVRRRSQRRLKTTQDLAEAVSEALDFVSGTPEEVRTVFQAVRIAVNGELESLDMALNQAVAALGPGGRLVAIAFHSGEDRIVKQIMRAEARAKRELWPDGRVRAVTPARLRLLTPKPVQPEEQELRANPRSHSARLRAAERLEEPR